MNRTFVIASLLIAFVMFALGWWARGVMWEREVEEEAHKIARITSGIYDPELGTIIDPPEILLELDEPKRSELFKELIERLNKPK